MEITCCKTINCFKTDCGFSLYLKTSKGGIYKDIYEGIMRNPDYNLVPFENGVWLLKQRQDFALIGDVTRLRTQLGSDCDISLIRETFYRSGFGLVLPQGSPYKKYFNEM